MDIGTSKPTAIKKSRVSAARPVELIARAASTSSRTQVPTLQLVVRTRVSAEDQLVTASKAEGVPSLCS